MNVPFVDLSKQYQSIKSEIDFAMQSVIEDTAFIQGKYVKSFESEFAHAGLQTVESEVVSVPRVKASKVSMECKLTDVVQLKTASGEEVNRWFIMGEVVGVHIDKSLIENGVYSTLKSAPVTRGGGRGDYYTISRDNFFEMLRPEG